MLWHATLDSTSSQWQTISLPREDKVGMVASGLSHSLVLSASGQGEFPSGSQLACDHDMLQCTVLGEGILDNEETALLWIRVNILK